ncbi:MAG: hypothetical protein ACYC3X_11260 [Pirellulaceae bacterium]
MPRRRGIRVGRAVSLGVVLVLNTCFLHAQQSTPSTTSTTQLNWVRKDGSSAQTTTQHSLSLAQSTSPRSAEPQSDVPAPVTVLRWRAPGVVRTQISSESASSPLKVVTVSASATNRGLVQQATATAPAIPYTEPDADEEPLGIGPQHSQAPLELPPAHDERPLLTNLLAQVQDEESIPESAAPTFPADPADPADPAAPTFPADPAAPSDLPQDDPPPVPQLLPEPAPSASGQSKNPSAETCDRTYNERDCCEDDKRCDSARQFWQRDALAKISLDITPQLRPEELDPYKEESLRNADLAKAPLRTWRNRQGNVLATGRLNNIQRGRLMLLDANNQIIKIPFRELSDDDLCFLTSWWRVPNECTLGDETYLARNWQPSTLTWKATGVCHKPLYFEEPQLERYGHTTGHFMQPLVSGAHFFVNLAALPYNAGINPPWECQYPLGYYRPGSCAPWLVPPVPLSVRGALWEAGAIVGGVALIP